MRRFCFILAAASLNVHALTETEIQGHIDEAVKAGGGEVVIPPGVHVIERGLVIKAARNLRLIGLDAEKCVLKAPPLSYAETAAGTPAGSDRIATARLQNIKPGMRLHIEADGETDSFTKKPKPYMLAIVKAVEKDAIVLKEPLKFPVPARALVRDEDAPNLIEVRGASEGVRIEKLTLDGGRTDGDPPVRGHAQLCGVFAAGPYSYEKGPTGPKVKGVVVSRCIIQRCFGRGVAFYSVDGSSVEDSTIMDTNDEAVDLDHFTTKTIVRHNHAARCSVGVELNDANDCAVEANEFRDCGTGINLWRWCRMPELNQGNRITGNLFTGARGNGIQIATGTARNTVSENEIRDSGRNGISLAGSNQIVRGNLVGGSKLKDVVVNEGEHEISAK